VTAPDRGPRASAVLACLVGGLIGAAFFLSLSSPRFVDPTEIGWAM
jgi:hypothetical protein